MQREGESGRKKINWYTRVLTIAILVFQAPAYLMNLKMQASQALAEAKSLTKITIVDLKAAGLTNGKELVKVLGNGELNAKIDVEANAFSKSAEEAIKAVGGIATII